MKKYERVFVEDEDSRECIQEKMTNKNLFVREFLLLQGESFVLLHVLVFLFEIEGLRYVAIIRLMMMSCIYTLRFCC